LDYLLELFNPESLHENARLEAWRILLNGQDVSKGFTLKLDENYIFPLKAASESPASFPLILKMDVDGLTLDGFAPEDEYRVELILSICFDSTPPEKIEVSNLAGFPGVQAPEFLIGEIAILQAELVNTLFRVAIQIVNPNPFPVELSTFSYELYGNGMFWADGAERDIIHIPGATTLHGNLFMMMNFIDMNRNLLEQIINLVDVNYRFTGEAQVSTGVEYLPSFSTVFDLSGYSQVLDN
jgi:LEA14-like dessication related protein